MKLIPRLLFALTLSLPFSGCSESDSSSSAQTAGDSAQSVAGIGAGNGGAGFDANGSAGAGLVAGAGPSSGGAAGSSPGVAGSSTAGQGDDAADLAGNGADPINEPSAGQPALNGGQAGALNGAGATSGDANAGAASESGDNAGAAGAAAGSDGSAGGGAAGSQATAGASGAAGSPSETAGDSGAAGASDPPVVTCDLPTTYQWESTGVLIGPQASNHASVKDPTVVWHEGQWHVIATVFDETADDYNMIYTAFADWSEAATAPQTYLATASPGLAGYNCAPQLFYFEPQQTWYLIYQTQDNYPAYSTNPTLSDPSGWTAPQRLYDAEPSVVTANKGNGFWIDYWVICDDARCYLFFSDDNGHYYRASTALGDFPNNFGTPEIILSDTPANLFEASNVYKVSGTDTFLLLIESRSTGRWFRAWTATSLGGTWTPLADTEQKPFAAPSNVGGEDWSQHISHGELLRDSVDQTLSINACDMQFLYQGIARDVTQEGAGGYEYLPYRLSLLSLSR